MSDYIYVNGEPCNTDELKHYGVLGMKWGVRRARKKSEKYQKKASQHKMYAEDYDPNNATYKMSDKKRAKLQAKSNKEAAKASEYERLAKNSTYKYKSHTTKKYEKKAAERKAYAEDYDPNNATYKMSDKKRAKLQAKSDKELAKAKKYENRAKRSAEMDAEEEKIARSWSAGKTAVAYALTAGIGIKDYQRFRAMGNGKAKAVLKTYAFASTPIASIQKARYIRQDER